MISIPVLGTGAITGVGCAFCLGCKNRILRLNVFWWPVARIHFCKHTSGLLDDLFCSQLARSLRTLGGVADALLSLDGLRYRGFIPILGILASRACLNSVSFIRFPGLPTVSRGFPHCGWHFGFNAVRSFAMERPYQSGRSNTQRSINSKTVSAQAIGVNS